MNFLKENGRMNTGILEVLVVDAKGIIHTNLVGIFPLFSLQQPNFNESKNYCFFIVHFFEQNIAGTPSYYVVIECGTQTQRTKVSSG